MGDVEGKVPGMGDAEGTGKDENGYEEIGSVTSAAGEVFSICSVACREGKSRKT